MVIVIVGEETETGYAGGRSKSWYNLFEKHYQKQIFLVL